MRNTGTCRAAHSLLSSLDLIFHSIWRLAAAADLHALDSFGMVRMEKHTFATYARRIHAPTAFPITEQTGRSVNSGIRPPLPGPLRVRPPPERSTLSLVARSLN